MKEWFSKNRDNLLYGTAIGSILTMTASYLMSLFKSDKRQIETFSKANTVLDTELQKLRGHKE